MVLLPRKISPTPAPAPTPAGAGAEKSQALNPDRPLEQDPKSLEEDIQSGAFRFDFGKYNTWPVKEVPTGYLQWFYDNCENPNRPIFTAVEYELQRRGVV